jgi:hypothetical protein
MVFIMTIWKKMYTFLFQIALWVIAMESFGTPPKLFNNVVFINPPVDLDHQFPKCTVVERSALVT